MVTDSHSRSSTTGLVDQFNRRIDYVRLSVTDKCNMRCFYCMPERFKEFEQPANWLTFDEIERVIQTFAEMGVANIRLTGGEPLVRKDLPVLARNLASIDGIEDLSLSTNASLLSAHAGELFNAGVSRINVSLDTLKADRFKSITGANLNDVLEGLQAAKAAGLSPVKINMVAMKGINDDEFGDMLEFCETNGFTLRFIETMPMGSTGQEAGQHYLNLQQVKKELTEQDDLIPGVMAGAGPARYLQARNSGMKIGFITPMSQHFCETCNRVRLSVDGTLYLCLGQDYAYPLREKLRSGISDDGLKNAVMEAINIKPERHEFNENPGKQVRFMSQTGG